jgi:DNA modification methylase
MSIRLLEGDCRVTLPLLEPTSVQCVITSPPYWGLRDYGTPPLVWGGDAHEHEWGVPVLRRLQDGTVSPKQSTHRGNSGVGFEAVCQFCVCGAWLGSLGLEPDPSLYIEHLVECFREVKRVLRDDGTLWLNLGDSYAGSGKGPSESLQPLASQMQRVGPQPHTIGSGRVLGAKPKDLLMMPFRVAQALQQDGWYLRSVIPWVKRNSMPESVTDRPSTSVEYVFLLAKKPRYYWDADAVRMPLPQSSVSRLAQDVPSQAGTLRANGGAKTNGPLRAVGNVDTGRNRRNSDWFFETWQGLMLDEDDDPLALVVNPAPYVGAHYATFPPKLVAPMVKASTRPGDLVLDPFGGAGTVGLVADRLGRDALLCELSSDYGDQAGQRLVGDAPLLVDLQRGGG